MTRQTSSTRTRVLLMAASLVCVMTFQLAADEPTQYHRDLLRQADANWSFMESDFSAEYTIVRDVPGEGQSETVAAVFRRDAEELYTILIMEPAIDRGQGYLKQGDTLWFYDPDSHRFNSTSSRDRFQNSNARNSDFTRSTLAEDYEILSVERVRLGRYDAWLYELESDSAGVTYPYMRLWLSDEAQILKTEDHSLSRQLLRITAVPEYQQVGGRSVPRTVYIIDMLEGAVIDGQFVSERTVLSINRPSLAPLPDSVFSKTFLENASQ